MTTAIVIFLISSLIGLALSLLFGEAKRDMDNVIREWSSSDDRGSL